MSKRTQVFANEGERGKFYRHETTIARGGNRLRMGNIDSHARFTEEGGKKELKEK